jgi:rhamnogalacturonyl hydrolase YesR
MVELPGLIPVNHPERRELIRLLNRQITSLNRYQDASGRWYQLVDKENTYLETSSSAIYTYAIAKAINKD